MMVIKTLPFLFAASACFLSGFVTACSQGDAVDASAAQIIDVGASDNPAVTLTSGSDGRANPPYFPLANGCALPELTPEMERLQIAVMARLGQGIALSELDPEVLADGATIIYTCGGHGALGADPLKLYLVEKNLAPMNTDGCEGGKAYRGRVSTQSPTLLHGNMPRIECAAMKPVTIGQYDVAVCVKDGAISALDILPREAVDTPGGMTVPDPKTPCSGGK